MKVLTIVLCLTFFISFSFAAEQLDVGPLSGAPTVDGVADGVYGAEVPIDVVDTTATAPDDDDDFSAYMQIGYTADSLYIFMSITDDVMDTDDAASDWNNDGYEVYFDGDYSRGETYDGIDDLHITIEANEDSLGGVNTNDADLWTGTSCNFAILPNDYGYDCETAFHLGDAYLADAVTALSDIGFDVQLNDADGEGREHMLRFCNPSNDNWVNASIWGTVTFVATGIDQPDAPIAKDFNLDQNYPNPFNPSTTISYNLNTAAKVNLTVYNVLGKEIATLVNEFQSQGDQKVVFDGENLTSGVYFYKLTVGSNVETKKMILMK
jgi:hypothetical protein